MSVLVLFEPQAAPGKADELVSLLAGILPDTRAFDGCVSLTVYRDHDEPERLVLVERWISRDQHAAYLRWRAERGDIERLGPLLAGPPSTRFYDEVDI